MLIAFVKGKEVYMTTNKLSSSDYLLLLLALDDKKPIVGAIRLMKMMFLFDKEIAPVIEKKGAQMDVRPDFIAYDFGPFSKDIYEQIEFFETLKFIETSQVGTSDSTDELDDWETLYGEDVFDVELKDGYRKLHIDYKSICYSLAERGEKYVNQKIIPELSAELINILQEFKKKINSVTTQQLLYYVYSRYENYTTASKIKDRVLGTTAIMPDESELVNPDENDDNN